MIARIITASARNPLLVVLFTAFLVAAGIWAVLNTPLDALPDLSDTQVIVYTEDPGQAPQVVEDQVTYPLTTALLAVPLRPVLWLIGIPWEQAGAAALLLGTKTILNEFVAYLSLAGSGGAGLDAQEAGEEIVHRLGRRAQPGAAHHGAEVELGRVARDGLYPLDRHLPAAEAGVAGVEVLVPVGRHVGLGDDDALGLAGGGGDVGAVADAVGHVDGGDTRAGASVGLVAHRRDREVHLVADLLARGGD